jgi:NitT/TauT family transport system ATP-binding protein
MCVVAAEMIAASSGLGYEIQLNRQLLRLDRVVAGMIVIGIVGFLMNKCLSRLETHFLPWRAQTGNPDSDDDIVPSSSVSPSKANLDREGRTVAGASIKLDNVSFAHGSHVSGQPVLANLNLDVKSGEVLCILGSSGCGKTTLLRLIAGLAKPSAGSILVDDRDISKHADEITMVFQNSALFPWRTAEGNVRFALESRHRQAIDIKAKALEYLRLVGLEGKSQSYPQQLSGGQQQRVALARALAYGPRILLMDEPFASLDSQTRESLQEELSALLHAQRITAVFVTHDIREAIFLADRVAVFSRRGGRLLAIHKIEQSLPRDASFRYSSEFSASRLYLWNLLKDAADE